MMRATWTAAAVLWLGTLAMAAEEAKPEAGKIDFVKQIRPIIEAHCIKCHGPEKQKGKLRLDKKAEIFKGEKDDWMVHPGSPDDSEFYHRVNLPPDDDDIMPNEGEPLNKEQIKLIHDWIKQGADWPDGADIIDPKSLIPVIEVPELTDKQQTAEAKAIEALRSRGALAMRIATNTPALDVNFSLIGKEITDADVSLLDGMQSGLVWLNLASTSVTDEAVARLKQFKELRILHLENTAVGDAGISHLVELKKLEYLNLYGTNVTNSGLERLEKLTSLRKLYLWQTAVTDESVAKLQAALPDLQIDTGKYARQMLEKIKELKAKAEAEAKVKKEAEERAKAKAEAEATFLASLTPVNAKCPVSGEDVNPDQKLAYKGQAVGFCCEKCLAKFKEKPDELIAKVSEYEQLKPINAKCPFSGEDINPEAIAYFRGQAIGFCCQKCLSKFNENPEEHLETIPEFKDPLSAKPINAKCPVSGENINPEAVFVYKGKGIGFCCEKCLAKFKEKPEEYIEKVAEFKAP